jgi:uncharacterized membrane protein
MQERASQKEMIMLRRTIAVVAIAAAVAAPAWAGRNQADELPSTAVSQQQERVAQANQQPCRDTQSPAVQHQQQEVRNLLNRLEAGQNVSPAEVERVLRQSVNP